MAQKYFAYPVAYEKDLKWLQEFPYFVWYMSYCSFVRHWGRHHAIDFVETEGLNSWISAYCLEPVSLSSISERPHPPTKRPKFQSKQGSLSCSRYIWCDPYCKLFQVPSCFTMLSCPVEGGERYAWKWFLVYIDPTSISPHQLPSFVGRPGPLRGYIWLTPATTHQAPIAPPTAYTCWINSFGIYGWNIPWRIHGAIVSLPTWKPMEKIGHSCR